jgi:hypothetical protein
MSPTADTRRLRRSLAAVESRYVRDLARRGREGPRAPRAVADGSGGSGGATAGRGARRDAPKPHDSGRPVRGAA